MFWWILFLVLVQCPAQSAGQSQPTADWIMARVAANQDRAVKQRAEYVYQQEIRIVSRKTNGKMMRDETRDYLVTPTPDGTKKKLERISGRAWFKGRYIDFTKDPGPKPHGLDWGLVDGLRDGLANEKSKNGLARDLFPLTSHEQKSYRFRLEGETTFEGRRVYRIHFAPRDRQDVSWTGEALIDAQASQPVRVYTKLSRKLPFLVRDILGTGLPGLGFDVEFSRFGEGVWFPVSFGTEFRLRVIFFIKRDLSVSLSNSRFERVHVKSKVLNYKPVR